MGLLLLPFLVCSFSLVLGKNVVTRLPGFNGTLPFELETGYIEVDESNEVNLFYYFCKSERNPSSDPVILWITGGPGCTGLSPLRRMGPLDFEEVESYEFGKLPTLSYRKGSFSSISNIIFVDSPAGAGFSYSKGDINNEWSDTRTSTRLNAFIRKWLLVHDEFISNDFYVAGDSYGGKITPIVVHELTKGNDAGEEPHVNLKGYFIGNPVTSDNHYDSGTRIIFSHGMGLISHELYLAAQESCSGNYATPANTKCRKCVDEVKRILAELNSEHILLPRCDLAMSMSGVSSSRERRSLTEKREKYSGIRAPQHEGCPDYSFVPVKFWADNSAVRDALGVAKDRIGGLERCPNNIKNAYKYDIPTAIPFHMDAPPKVLRSLIYSGDHDPKINFMGTQAWIKSLNFSIIDKWQSWMVDGQVAGYTKTYANNMTFATVKGAGHVASSTNLKECVALIERWIWGRSL